MGTQAPVEYAVAVEEYLGQAALGPASRRVYRVSLTGWAWPIVGKPTPSGAERRRAAPPIVPLALLDEPATATRLGEALTERAGLADARTVNREVSALRSAAAGTFSLNSTIDISTNHTSTQTFPQQTGVTNSAWATEFEMGEYAVQCVTAQGVVENTHYEIFPYQWNGGASVSRPASAPALSASNCVPEPAGSHFQTGSSTAINITHGYDIKGGTVVNEGFTGTSQTGYDVNAEIGLDFTQNGTLCGTNGKPTVAATMVAHA